MKKFRFIFALVAAVFMITGCGKSNSNTGKTLELIIYFESSDVSSCKEELHKWLGDKMRYCQKNIRQMKNRRMNSGINMI